MSKVKTENSNVDYSTMTATMNEAIIAEGDAAGLNRQLVMLLATANDKLKNHYFADMLDLLADTTAIYNKLAQCIKNPKPNEWLGMHLYVRFRHTLCDLLAGRKSLEPDDADKAIAAARCRHEFRSQSVNSDDNNDANVKVTRSMLLSQTSDLISNMHDWARFNDSESAFDTVNKLKEMIHRME